MAGVRRALRSLGYAVRSPRTALDRHRETVELRRRLSQHPLFTACNRGELRTLMRWGDEIEVPAGVALLHEQAIGSCMLAVLDGSLRTTVRRRPLGQVSAGEWIGDTTILGFGPEAATVTTETVSRLFVLGRRAVLSFATAMPGLRASLFPSLDERAANVRVRELRAAGLARWKQLKITPPERLTPETRPPWLRVHPNSRRIAGELGFLSELRPSAPPPATAPKAFAHPWRVAGIATAATVVVLTIPAATVRIPYYSMHGSVRSATRAVHAGHDAASAGTILYPIVDVSRSTPLIALRDWWDADADVRPTDEVLGGLNAADVDRTNKRLMETAKADAVRVVGALLGDSALDPTRITIVSGDIGGPSAGLPFALALVDQRTPGELTGSRMIAATGEITPEGKVRAVGGVRLKTLAARRAGCVVFVVPKANHDEAARVAGPMVLLPVTSLAEAVQKLVAMGGAITA